LGAICAKVILLFLFPETVHLKTVNVSARVTDGLPKLACTGVLCSDTLLKKTERAAAAIMPLVKLLCLTSLQDKLGRVSIAVKRSQHISQKHNPSIL